MSFLSQITSTLGTAQSLVEGGKVNLTVSNPVIRISASEALDVAQPYIIALIAIVGVVGLMLLIKKG
jgi:hypothetical protein